MNTLMHLLAWVENGGAVDGYNWLEGTHKPISRDDIVCMIVHVCDERGWTQEGIHWKETLKGSGFAPGYVEAHGRTLYRKYDLQQSIN